MTFRMTPKGKPHELKGKPFCMTLAYPSVGDGQSGNGGSGSHLAAPLPAILKAGNFIRIGPLVLLEIMLLLLGRPATRQVAAPLPAIL